MMDYHNGKPYVPDIEKWRNHFAKLVKGHVHPDHNGDYHVEPLQSDGDEEV
jgi:hypothetical protein